MRILVTRPRNQTEQLVRMLELMGYETECLPLLDILPVTLEDSEIDRLVSDINSADKLISVSANAANASLPLLEKKTARDMPELFSIGPSTAAVYENVGYKVSIPESNYNSESLLELKEFSDIKNQKILIFCGQGGRDYLEQTLSERGAEVKRAELYARVPAALEKLKLESVQQPDVLTAMSGDTVTALSLALNAVGKEAWQDLPLIVPGVRVEGIARERGFTDIHPTEKPNTESLLDTLGKLAEAV